MKDLSGNGMAATYQWSFHAVQPLAGYRQLGSAANETSGGVAIDSNRNIVVTGATFGALDGATSAGQDDAILVKHDAAGNRLWTRQFGDAAADNDGGVGVATDAASGAVYVTGYWGHYSSFRRNGFLAKYDGAGSQLWWKDYSRTELRPAVDPAGSIYAAGYRTWGWVPGSSCGHTAWGGPAYPEITALAVNSSGAVLAGKSRFAVGATSSGPPEVFVLKCDAGGNYVWSSQSGMGAATAVALDATGNIFVAGTTSGALDGTSAGESDLFLRRYDPAGNVVWTRQLESSLSDLASAVAVGAQGGVFVTGSTMGDLDGHASTGDQDVFLVKYDGAGNKLWSRQFGTPATDRGTGLAVDPLGGVVIAGTTSSALGGAHLGGSDVFLLRFSADGGMQQRSVGGRDG